MQIAELIADIEMIAQGMLPDGDGVNVSTSLWAEGWVKRLNGNGKPKKIRGYVKLDGKSRESKILSVLDKAIRFRTSSKSAISTAELDSTLREHGYVVMSISTRLSRLRTTWKATGVGNLNRVDTIAPDKKRICSYWREEVIHAASQN